MDIDLANLQPITKYSRLTNLQQRYPYVPVKPERKAREEIKDITALGSSCSLCWWWARAGGLPVLLLHPSGTCSHSFPKVLKMSWWVCGGVLVVLQPPPARLVAALCKRLTSLPVWHLERREVGFTSRHPASAEFHTPIPR